MPAGAGRATNSLYGKRASSSILPQPRPPPPTHPQGGGSLPLAVPSQALAPIAPPPAPPAPPPPLSAIPHHSTAPVLPTAPSSAASHLNSEQWRAVSLPRYSAAAVIAGPGSGKTRVIVYRIAYLVSAARVRPGRVLALTFTNKAAREVLGRVRALQKEGFSVFSSVAAIDTSTADPTLTYTSAAAADSDGSSSGAGASSKRNEGDGPGARASEPWVRTFHGLCRSMLSRFPVPRGYPAAAGPTVIDEREAQRLLKAAAVAAVALLAPPADTGATTATATTAATTAAADATAGAAAGAAADVRETDLSWGPEPLSKGPLSKGVFPPLTDAAKGSSGPPSKGGSDQSKGGGSKGGAWRPLDPRLEPPSRSAFRPTAVERQSLVVQVGAAYLLEWDRERARVRDAVAAQEAALGAGFKAQGGCAVASNAAATAAPNAGHHIPLPSSPTATAAGTGAVIGTTAAAGARPPVGGGGGGIWLPPSLVRPSAIVAPATPLHPRWHALGQKVEFRSDQEERALTGTAAAAGEANASANEAEAAAAAAAEAEAEAEAEAAAEAERSLPLHVWMELIVARLRGHTVTFAPLSVPLSQPQSLPQSLSVSVSPPQPTSAHAHTHAPAAAEAGATTATAAATAIAAATATAAAANGAGAAAVPVESGSSSSSSGSSSSRRDAVGAPPVRRMGPRILPLAHTHASAFPSLSSAHISSIPAASTGTVGTGGVLKTETTSNSFKIPTSPTPTATAAGSAA